MASFKSILLGLSLILHLNVFSSEGFEEVVFYDGNTIVKSEITNKEIMNKANKISFYEATKGWTNKAYYNKQHDVFLNTSDYKLTSNYLYDYKKQLIPYFSLYRVGLGESLKEIAFKLYGDYRRWTELALFNSHQVNKYQDIREGMLIRYINPTNHFVRPQGKPYVIKEGDTLESIGEKIYGRSIRWWRIWKNNKQYFKNGWNLLAGFTLFYKNQRVLTTKRKKIVNLVRDNSDEEPVSTYKIYQLLQKQDKQRSSKLYTFFALSQGTFSETVPSTQVQVQSSQNSPITLGLGGSNWLNRNWFLDYSAYFSKLTASLNLSSNNAISVPLEIGTTLHINGSFKSMGGYTPFIGLDYEKFSTFNIDELQSLQDSLVVRNHSILYAVAGISKFFPLKSNQGMFLKLSYGPSLTSSSDVSGITPFKGNKLIGFLAYKASSTWTYNSFYKVHTLLGQTDLTVTRIGLGLSYNFK